MIAMNIPFWLSVGAAMPRLRHGLLMGQKKDQKKGQSIGKSLGGALSALLCTAAVANHDLQHLRQQELRSTVRQQMTKPAPARPNPVQPVAQPAAQAAAQGGLQAAAEANARHLNAQERIELRRQLASDLQAQRTTMNGR